MFTTDFLRQKKVPAGQIAKLDGSERRQQADAGKMVRRPEKDLDALRQVLPIARRNIHSDRRRSFGGMRPGAYRDDSQFGF